MQSKGPTIVASKTHPDTASSHPETEKIRLLILEEEAEADLLVAGLQRAGLQFTHYRAETEMGFVQAMSQFNPSIVLAGAALPTFSGRHALKFTRHSHPETPLIVVGDRVPAEEAFTFLAAGAKDYIFKDDLTRLGPAVTAALRWEQGRRKRSRTEQLLRLSELRYRRLFEAAKDGILLLDADSGKITDANPFMVELLGYSHSEFLGKHIWEVGSLVDIVASQDAFKELQAAGYIRYDDLPLRTKSGRMIAVEFVSNVYSEDSQSTIQCNIRDISQRKATEQALFQAQKMAAIGTFTGGVAHNINNLLGVITGNLELLRGHVGQNGEAAGYIDEAFEAAMRGAELVQHMLAFARAQPLRPQRLDLNALLLAVTKTLRSMLGENIALSLSISDDGVWPILADRAQLEACLMNLAMNASEAMPDGGRIELSASNHHLDSGAGLIDPVGIPGNYVELSVRDTGGGMAPEIMSHIFEPFFSTKSLSGKPGTGLGLSTVYGFIKQSGGNIGVESKPFSGTVFRLYLPSLAEQSVVKTVADQVGRTSLARHETVLVVEDNPALRQVVVRQIERLGYNVLQADEATSALSELSRGHVDLLFTDLVIPGDLDGLALAKMALERWPSLRIVLTTGLGESAGRGDVSGFQVLGKPYRMEKLAHALRDALGEPATRI